MPLQTKSLEQYREEYKQKKLITMPIAGAIVWLALGITALFVPVKNMVLPVYIGTGCIFYLALFISRFTGEKLLMKKEERNPFDTLFLYTLGMSWCAFAVAIPFGLENYTAVPMAIGIVSGLMWLPISWSLEHNVGIIHTLLRTALIVIAWYVFPEQRFVVIPFGIVLVYAISLYQLLSRYQQVKAHYVAVTL
ncbi:hypothetical protein EXU30_17765 [Shewanella maritima]|uniref:Uncharacterized protein n=1 Tax=Shewanella maritima TaxID=2520507 RepID=A0A411PLD4_9GAMM|nr:hypothetical protein [Shewanella maritima]QBF84315.1 hypothetical protein EXU30_17765 [Shewanella maritima]